jgi:cytochrome P450
VDALQGLTSATLDIIGLAGFGYEFGALARSADAPSELADAFTRMFSSTDITVWNMLELLFPVLRAVPTAQNRSFRHGRRVLDRIGTELIAERKAMAAYVEHAVRVLR